MGDRACASKFIFASALTASIALSTLTASSAVSFVAPSRSAVSADETIRVRLKKIPANAISVIGLGLRFAGQAPFDSGFRAFSVRRLNALAPGLAPTWVVTDRDRGGVMAKIKSHQLLIQGESVRVGLHSVPDQVALVTTLNSNGMDLIATLDLENYLQGVLPSEMPASWPLEALKAQAVAARTFALFRKAHKAKVASQATFDVESDVMDQVFKHPLAGEKSARRTANVKKAIEATRSIVLTDSKQEPLQAYFHADCGGRTEDAGVVWGGGESAGTAVDGSCPLNPKATWTARLSGEWIAAKLKKLSLSKAPAAGIEILERTTSGRVDKMKIAWADGRSTIVSGHAFRMAVGFNDVKSTQFKIEKTSSGFVLAGVGFGHGVGLCQWGAKQMAKSGKSYEEILAHYYPRAEFGRNGIKGREVLASITSPRRL